MLKHTVNDLMLALPDWDATMRGELFEELVLQNLWRPHPTPEEEAAQPHGLVEVDYMWYGLVELLLTSDLVLTAPTVQFLEDHCAPLELPKEIRLRVWEQGTKSWERVVMELLNGIPDPSAMLSDMVRSRRIALPAGGLASQPSTPVEYMQLLLGNTSVSTVAQAAARLRALLMPAGNISLSSTRPVSPVPLYTQTKAEQQESQEALLDRAVVALHELRVGKVAEAQLFIAALLYLEDDEEEAQARCVQEALQKPVEDALISFAAVDVVLPATQHAIKAPLCLASMCFTIIETMVNQLTTVCSMADGNPLPAVLQNLFHWLGMATTTHLTDGTEDASEGDAAPPLLASSSWCDNQEFLCALHALVRKDYDLGLPPKSQFSIKVRTDAHYDFLYKCLLPPPPPPPRQEGAPLRLSIRLPPRKLHMGHFDGFDVFLTCYELHLLRTGEAGHRLAALKYLAPLWSKVSKFVPILDAVRGGGGVGEGWLQPDTNEFLGSSSE